MMMTLMMNLLFMRKALRMIQLLCLMMVEMPMILPSSRLLMARQLK